MASGSPSRRRQIAAMSAALLGVAEPGVQGRHQRQRETRLADAAGPGERQQAQPRTTDQRLQLLHLVVPTNQRRRRVREARLGAQGPQRRKGGRKIRCGQLEDVLGLVDVLEPVPPQVDQLDAVREPVADQLPGRAGDHDLPAVGGRGDAGSPVEIQPDVALVEPRRLAGVHAHPNPSRCAIGPGRGREGPLRLQARSHGIVG